MDHVGFFSNFNGIQLTSFEFSQTKIVGNDRATLTKLSNFTHYDLPINPRSTPRKSFSVLYLKIPSTTRL